MRLLEPVTFGPRTAPNRVMFGPHVTNLGDDDRRLTERHVAYYARRARGGCGTIVIEGASVHESDWPYERAPLAARCRDGWASIAAACHPHGALVIAALDHAGGQGSSAYHQRPLWAPSRVPEVNTREVPKWMETGDIEAVVDGFASAARLAAEAGLRRCRNQRRTAQPRAPVPERAHQPARRRVGCRSRLARATGDRGGPRRCPRPDRRAAAVVRRARAVGRHHAGAGPGHRRRPRRIGRRLRRRRARLDLLVREDPTRLPRADRLQHRAVSDDPGRDDSAAVDVPVVLQGSVVDAGQAEWALGDDERAAVCDAVEMTRAQIADPDLVAKLGRDAADEIRPCTRCNQTCQVRDVRNPIVTCIGEPTSGRETEDPDWYAPATTPKRIVVLGGGPAGMETARVAASARARGRAHRELAASRWPRRRRRAERSDRRLARTRDQTMRREHPPRRGADRRRAGVRGRAVHRLAFRVASVRRRSRCHRDRHRRRAARARRRSGRRRRRHLRPDRRTDRDRPRRGARARGRSW